MLGSVNPREVLHSFDDVFHLCVRLHTAAAGVRDLERKFNAVAARCGRSSVRPGTPCDGEAKYIAVLYGPWGFRKYI